jgi:hypothetical protein
MLDQNVQPGGIPKTVEIMIDVDSALMGQALNNDAHIIIFNNIWDRTRLFLHSNFTLSRKYGYVCEVGESYHKLVKKYSILSDSFDIWFTIDGKTIFTPEIDSLVLELSFIE